MNFIQNVGPSIFPSQLQSGRILYYNSIPSTINTSVWPPTDLNQRFWKDYIDYVLGVMQVGSNNSYVCINNATTGIGNLTGYGNDFNWGTAKITPRGNLSGTPTPYMQYGDNPQRPILSFWFGPMTMVDFLGNYNLWYTGYGNDASRYCWWPGTCHESPTYACKLGIQAALNDMQNNHPNDFISMIFFSTPLSSSSDTSASRFNRVRIGLSQSYSLLTDSLWYPPATVGNPTATVSPYDADNLEVPRATGGTCYAMGLMLAYNQFSGNSALLNYNTATYTACLPTTRAAAAARVRRRSSSSRPTATPTPRRGPISSTADHTTPITRSAITRTASRPASIPTMSTAMATMTAQ